MKSPQRYTITDYRREMADIQRSLPSTWTAKAITYLPDPSSASMEEHRNRFRRVLRGMSYDIGVRKGYINALRRIHAEHNGTEYTKLDPNCVVSIEA